MLQYGKRKLSHFLGELSFPRFSTVSFDYVRVQILRLHVFILFVFLRWLWIE